MAIDVNAARTKVLDAKAMSTATTTRGARLMSLPRLLPRISQEIPGGDLELAPEPEQFVTDPAP